MKTFRNFLLMCCVVYASTLGGVASAASLTALGVPILEKWTPTQVHDYLRDTYGLGSKRNRQGLGQASYVQFLDISRDTNYRKIPKSILLKESGIWLKLNRRQLREKSSPFQKVDSGLQYTHHALWLFYNEKLAYLEIVFGAVRPKGHERHNEKDETSVAYLQEQSEFFTARYGAPTKTVDDTDSVAAYKKESAALKRNYIAQKKASKNYATRDEFYRLSKEIAASQQKLKHSLASEAVSTVTQTWLTDGGRGKIELINVITYPGSSRALFSYRLRFSNTLLAEQAKLPLEKAVAKIRK